MTVKEIHAIDQVLTINKDIVDLYEKRGVPRDAIVTRHRPEPRA